MPRPALAMNASPAPTDPAWCSVGRSLRAAGIDPDGWTADPDMLGRLIERIDDQQRSIASSPQVAVHHIVAEPAGAGAALDPAHDDAFVWRPDEGPGSADVAGPLAGCRLAVKDNISVAGAPTGAGLAGVSFNSGDAEVVARLRALGATVVGTTTLPELAIGEHPVPTRNPRDRTRGCGGSSTGSAAAVASGRADLGLGTDTAGSVRLPAALCGVVGYKPSTGVLPIDGVVPLAWSLDTVGVLAPDVAAARAAMAALLDAGAAPHEPSGDWSGARVGVVPQLTVDLDAEVEPAYGEVVRAISRAGATLVDVPFGWLDQALAASSVVIATEAAAAHGHLVSAGLVSPDVARRLCAGALYTGVQYARACRAVRGVAAAYGSIAGEVDVIVTPTVPTVAPPFDGKVPGATRLGWIRSSVVWSVAGAPAVSVPVPSAGLPVGVQVSGRRGDDAAVLAWAASLERTVRR